MTASRLALALACCALVLAGVAGATKPRSNDDTGSARVFWTNPVESLEDKTLTDQKDAARAVPEAAYHGVTLTHLDGSGFLRGDYARIRSETGNPAYSPTNTFVFDRKQDEFEQVMAYYWITEAQLYLQHLGFRAGGPFPAILDEGIDARINTLGFDNSYFWDKHHVVRFGKGGVDDAEDGEVILHEYGHAIHGDQVPGFGPGLESGAIGEAFGDYFAVSMGEWKTGNDFDVPCVADWDATSYDPRPCLRRVDGNLVWPKDRRDEVHADGRIWSRALWDIRQAFGPEKADRIIINAQFDFAADTTFAAAAKATVAEAVAQDPATEDVVCKAFVDRGFITNADC